MGRLSRVIVIMRFIVVVDEGEVITKLRGKPSLPPIHVVTGLCVNSLPRITI